MLLEKLVKLRWWHRLPVCWKD